MPRRVSAPPSQLPAALYAGTVNTWECDEGGHLNVRFHIERAMAGLAFLAVRLGMRPSNGAAAATLAPLELYVRYHNEARAGEGLSTHGGVVEMSQTGAQITRRNLNVQPTIKVPAGYKFTVRVNRDILFDAPYQPVQANPLPLQPPGQLHRRSAFSTEYGPGR